MNVLKSVAAMILALLVCVQAPAQTSASPTPMQVPAQLAPKIQEALKQLEADPYYKALPPDEQKYVRDSLIEDADTIDRPIQPRGRDTQLTTVAPTAPPKKPDCTPVPVKKPGWLTRRTKKILDEAQKKIDKTAAPVVKSVGDPAVTKLPSVGEIAKAMTEPCPAAPAKKQ